LSGLELISIETSRGKKRELVETILRQNGADIDDHEIMTITTYEHFPIAKNNIIRAILAINDLYYLSPRTVSTVFKEQVETFLQENNVRYSTGFGLIGRSGLYQPFHFLIQTIHREIIVQAIGRPIRQWISLFMLSWNDVSSLRKQETVAFGILNDEGITVEETLVTALKSYEIRPYLWSERESLLHELKA
ncbi:prophage protein, partial [mine drainage metagenome]